MVKFLGAFMAMTLSLPLWAGTVRSVKNQKLSKPYKGKSTVLTVDAELADGVVGQDVEIKNRGNYIVAKGKILKKRGRFAKVIITEKYGKIEINCVVTAVNHDSIDHWSATTAPF